MKDNLEDINPNLFAKCGYKVYETYIINGKYKNTTELLDEIFYSGDVIHMKTFTQEVINLSVFREYVRRNVEKRNIISVKKGCYICMDEIYAAGLSEEDIKTYVASILINDLRPGYYTVKQLDKTEFGVKAANAIPEIDINWFKASLLQQYMPTNFSSCIIGRDKIFKKEGKASSSEFIKQINGQYHNTDEAVYDLNFSYGVRVTKDQYQRLLYK